MGMLCVRFTFSALLDEYPIEMNTKMHKNNQVFFCLILYKRDIGECLT
jgi:hypothetical protein